MGEHVLATGCREGCEDTLVDADLSHLAHIKPREIDVVVRAIHPPSALPPVDPAHPCPPQLFHGECPDGFAAAYAAWLVLGDGARYVGLRHDEDKEERAGDLRGKRVAVLDFSFDADATARHLATASEYVVLDHHASAEENLRALPGANKAFEERMSGATLAWSFFHPGTEVPLLFRYVEDRDIWRWSLHHSDAFAAAFDLTAGIPGAGEVTSRDFEPLDRLFKGGDGALQRLLVAGGTILRYQRAVVANHPGVHQAAVEATPRAGAPW